MRGSCSSGSVFSLFSYRHCVSTEAVRERPRTRIAGLPIARFRSRHKHLVNRPAHVYGRLFLSVSGIVVIVTILAVPAIATLSVSKQRRRLHARKPPDTDLPTSSGAPTRRPSFATPPVTLSLRTIEAHRILVASTNGVLSHNRLVRVRVRPGPCLPPARQPKIENTWISLVYHKSGFIFASLDNVPQPGSPAMVSATEQCATCAKAKSTAECTGEFGISL